MEYLARWRMSLARDALSRGATPLDRLAEEIGFAPGAFARACRGEAAAVA
jgi:AraC-like DNA-binding protein